MRLKKEAGENVEHNYQGSAANYQPACSVCALANGTQTPVEIKLARKDVFFKFSQLKFPTENAMNNVIYIVGLIVIVLAILKFAGII